VVAPGAHADRLRCELDGLDVAIVENRNWRDGIGSSIRVGVGHLRSVVPTAK
jgi:CTP:molybdopterin cytidylyltransferase MocA